MLLLPPLPNPGRLPVTGTPNAPPRPVSSPDYGMSMFLWGQPSTTERDLKIASGVNFRWQKTLFQWADIEGASARACFDWTEADRVVKASNKAGVKIIARLDFQPAWARRDGAHNGPPDNYQDFSDFVSAFATRYKTGSSIGTVDAIEVWNEVNLDREWGMQSINQPQAADYVRLLTGAYQAAHEANPQIVVITAGLSPTGVKTSRGLGRRRVPAVAVRRRPEGWHQLRRAWRAWQHAGARGRGRAQLAAQRSATQASTSVASSSCARSGQERRCRSPDLAARVRLDGRSDPSELRVVRRQRGARRRHNILKAFDYAKQNWAPWIGVMTLWTLPDPTWTTEREEYWWAITNPDGTARAALTAIRNARLAGLILE